jgi:hemoglobin
MKALAATFLLLALTTPLWAEDALFDDMGGQPGINKLVDASVDNYLADPRIKDIFSESNIDRIRAELKDQFCAVAGGPCRYTGHSMEATHKGLHLTNANFNALVEDLQSAMDSFSCSFQQPASPPTRPIPSSRKAAPSAPPR